MLSKKDLPESMMDNYQARLLETTMHCDVTIGYITHFFVDACRRLFSVAFQTIGPKRDKQSLLKTALVACLKRKCQVGVRSICWLDD
jgi:hypothetical protein